MSTTNTKTDDAAYDALRSIEEVAAERGQVAVFPKANELFIDIDSLEQCKEFYRRAYYFGLEYDQINESHSRSGGEHRHIKVTMNQTFTDIERVAWQAALNDDPLKVFLTVLRIQNGIQNPTTLFETQTTNQEK